ncbi:MULTISPECIES: flavodoxin [Neobacillus]|uniref:Flavodoxin n=1 Tax=Neobacillus citreus TaxID=2833578 RepID=A0A942YD59_9BACI|nr:flavodoxin [Neobacillus citreus]MCH6267547.1 flavodoxin [Neobacillus citreus]
MDTIIIYTSMAGTTELMAEMIGGKLTEAGERVVIKDALEAYAHDLQSYDRVLIGSYTWGDGDLPDEMVDFYEELSKLDLNGKQAAVFGPGDSTYPHFARAVDIWEEAIQAQGGEIVVEGLKIDRWYTEELEAACAIFSEKLIQSH